jgi:hypothetical protein
VILGYVVHALMRTDHIRRSYGLCGGRARRGTTEPDGVTCARCLASLRKRARASGHELPCVVRVMACSGCPQCVIAAEEGRAL